MTTQKADSAQSFWRDLGEEVAARQLNRQMWFSAAKRLSEEEGRTDFITRATFYRWIKGERKPGTYWPWSGSVQYIVKAVVGLEEEHWKPWQYRWEEVRDCGDEPEERRKPRGWGKWFNWYTIAAGIIGLVAAVVSLYVNLFLDSGQAAENTGAQPPAANSPGQSGGVGGIREKADDIAKEARSEQDLIDRLRVGATTPPTGTGPWPFVVVDTQKEGAFARSTSEMIADRLGFAPEHSVVFVECQIKNSFTPPGVRRDVGPVWLRVYWKNTQPSRDSFLSDPSDPHRAWMYRGYLEPFEHNGEIPQCHD